MEPMGNHGDRETAKKAEFSCLRQYAYEFVMNWPLWWFPLEWL